ncbi:uncharacterized protein J4E88_007956 [Alternaria novae-zelandiae]|uniref:uncharacterized protein n=1 Tax=Alternaria novae-zelandiae TaxID=430562 RepID=UPI0020C20233|nr:uncharacterized protein J4E88_007956 [Alternaria novae-zelandiae]KAI4675052.1 hypothetical protein J4E88_007956 [Alternaria novae-zelandiae]
MMDPSSGFTPKKALASWTHAQLLQNYRELYTEYDKYATLAAQFDGPRLPFGRERNLHNLINARAKLEHDIKRLKKTYEEERMKLASQNLDAKLREALEQSRDTLAAVLDEDRRPPPDKLMKEKAELQNEKSKLLLQLRELLCRYKELLESRGKRGKDCDSSSIQEVESERDLLREDLDIARAECEKLMREVKYLQEVFGVKD